MPWLLLSRTGNFRTRALMARARRTLNSNHHHHHYAETSHSYITFLTWQSLSKGSIMIQSYTTVFNMHIPPYISAFSRYPECWGTRTRPSPDSLARFSNEYVSCKDMYIHKAFDLRCDTRLHKPPNSRKTKS
jgi:hypothetical protein